MQDANNPIFANKMKVYGTPDADTTAIDYLLSIVSVEQVESILHHPRIPIDARPCKLPQSLLVQAVMKDKTVINVRQNAPKMRATKI